MGRQSKTKQLVMKHWNSCTSVQQVADIAGCTYRTARTYASQLRREGHNLQHMRELEGKQSRSWKGGRRIASNGYVELCMPGHPKRHKQNMVFEHIVVAETMIGRPLNDDEEVHHINKNRADNRPENLEVLTVTEHKRKHFAFGTGIDFKPRLQKDQLEQLYCKEGMSAKNTAKTLKSDYKTVLKYLRYYNIEVKKRGNQK